MAEGQEAETSEKSGECRAGLNSGRDRGLAEEQECEDQRRLRFTVLRREPAQVQELVPGVLWPFGHQWESSFC